MTCRITYLFYLPCISNPIGFTWLTLAGPWSIGGYRFPSGARPGAGATEAAKILRQYNIEVKVIFLDTKSTKTTDKPLQTVQTQIRLLLEEQSDQDLHSLPFHLHLFDKESFNFSMITANILGV